MALENTLGLVCQGSGSFNWTQVPVLTEKGTWALINLHTPESTSGWRAAPSLMLPHGLGEKKLLKIQLHPELCKELITHLGSPPSQFLAHKSPRQQQTPTSFSSESGSLCTSQLAGGRFMARAAFKYFCYEWELLNISFSFNLSFFFFFGGFSTPCKS